ncbi:MAG: hypothetical protein EOO70_05255 [Myxococcaceae bacterium]|nr:MAG: hypothetical protein EOO70_05255 [Myxococcaceae bacterium]
MSHLTLVFLATSLLFAPACRRVVPPGDTPAATSVEATAIARPLMELQSPRYDGNGLSGRVLVGSEEGALILDRRFVESSTLDIVAVLDCATAQPLEFLVADRFPPPSREEDLLQLAPGYWFGAEVDFPLFDEQLNGKPGPDCIDVTLTFHPKPPTPAVTITARVLRPPDVPDAGAALH